MTAFSPYIYETEHILSPTQKTHPGSPPTDKIFLYLHHTQSHLIQTVRSYTKYIRKYGKDSILSITDNIIITYTASTTQHKQVLLLITSHLFLSTESTLYLMIVPFYAHNNNWDSKTNPYHDQPTIDTVTLKNELYPKKITIQRRPCDKKIHRHMPIRDVHSLITPRTLHVMHHIHATNNSTCMDTV